MYQHPGVYIEHVPSGALSIEAASTSVAAFIGPVKRGDLVTADKDKGKPVFVTSIGQFTRLFGELRGGNGGIRDFGATADAFGFAVNTFFNNGGNKAYIVPVGRGDGKEAVAAFVSPLDNTFGFYFNAKSEGVWANGLVAQLSIDVLVGAIDFAKSTFKVAFGLLDAKGKLNPVLEQFTGISLDQANPSFLVSKINTGSELVEARYSLIANNTTGGQTKALQSPVLSSLNIAALLAGVSSIDVKVDGAAPVTVVLTGATSIQDVASKIQAAVAPSAAGFLAQVTLDGRLLLISGTLGASSKVEVLGGPTAARLGLDPTAFRGRKLTPAELTGLSAAITGKKIAVKFGAGAANSTAALGALASLTLAAAAIQADPTISGAEAQFRAEAIDDSLLFYVVGGTDAKAISVVAGAPDGVPVLGLDGAPSATFRPASLSYPAVFDNTAQLASSTFAGGLDHTAPNQADYQAAFDRLRDYRDISIMLLPGKVWKGTDTPIIDAAVTHAEFMQNRMVIVDPPEPVGTDKLESPTDVNALGAPTSPYTALYYPWLEVVNPFYDKDTAPGKPKTFNIPPSSTGAGMWARIDGSRGVWKAPAGLEATVRGTLGPSLLIGNDLQDNLNEWGVNCLRAIIGPTVIWGARTLATKSKPEFRYIPVRRTQSMIGESLYNALQAVVFEPNDYKLWASLRASVGTFMDGLHRSGAFQGEKASDAYYVRCGLGSTMTQGDIDAGIVRVVVGFAPLKPAEFVVVQIQQIVGQTA